MLPWWDSLLIVLAVSALMAGCLVLMILGVPPVEEDEVSEEEGG